MSSNSNRGQGFHNFRENQNTSGGNPNSERKGSQYQQTHRRAQSQKEAQNQNRQKREENQQGQRNYRRRSKSQNRKKSQSQTPNVDTEVVNKLAKVLFQALQNGATAAPQWNFINQELKNEEIRDEDEYDDDDNSSVYSLTSNSKSSQNEQNSLGLSQSSFGDFHGLSQNDEFSGKKMSQQNVQQQMLYPNFFPKVGIFWDIENCPLPSGKSAMHFVKRMRDTFCNDHTEEKFLVVCDTHKQASGVIDELEKSLVRIEHVSGSAKNSADECLRRNMREFAENNLAPAKIVLITGDINFNSELHDMKYKRHFNVILIHNKHTSEALKLVASECHELEEFCVNLPKRNATAASEGPITVRVTHLPKDEERGKIKGRLNILVSTFGGKIIRLFDPPKEAIVQFSSRTDALRAQSSLNGEVIYGSKIKLYLIATPKTDNDESNGNGNKTQSSPPKNAEVDKKSSPDEKPNVDDPTGNPCLVSFCVNEKITTESLRQVLLKQVDEVDCLTLNYNEGNKRCYAFKCASLNSARKAVKSLNEIPKPQLYDVQKLQIKPGDERKISITASVPVVNSDLQVCLNLQHQYLSSHESKRNEINQRLLFLNSIDPRSSDATPLLAQEVVTLLKRYNLLVDMEKEFKLTSNNLLAKLQDGNQLHDPSEKFLIECMHLSKASPVYAYRREILTSFTTNPVTILSGNSGCGKSTQVIQYMYQLMGNEKWQNEKWQMVCTRSHKSLVTLVGDTVVHEMKMDKGISYKLSQSKDKKLFIVTDRTLLIECFTHRVLEGYTHLLIDDAQERNFSTEILLAYLKTIQPLRRDLRVMIMTTPDRSGGLSQFFYGCPVINIDFPLHLVENIWQTPSQNYVKEAIAKAIDLVSSESTGDILVFLPNASDVNYAAQVTTKKLEKDKVKVHKLLLIHYFAQTYKNLQGQSDNRHIIFATGELEKIISFPNVRFVIDCGLTTEYRKEINCKIAETKYVTITSAETRASKAALNPGGKCFRFYSAQKFSPVATQSRNSDVELLVLCVLRFRLNPSSFDFIEPPTNFQIQDALIALTKIKAVEANSITEKGSNLIKLPIDIHLSNVMVEGIKSKIEYEALCFIGVATTVHMYTVLTAETTNLGMKNLITLVDDYVQWSAMSEPAGDEFLQTNKITRATMEIIHEQVLELHATISEIGFAFKLNSTNNNWREKLQTIVANCWWDNLCVLQRPCDNVYTWINQNQQVRLLPSLASNQSCSQFVIFETCWKMRSGEYMTNIVPIDEEIMDVVQSGNVVENIKKVIQQEMSLVQPIGQHIMKNVIVGKNGLEKNQWEKKLSDLVNATVNISVSQNKSELKVYCALEHKTRVLDELHRAIESARAKMAEELWEFCICKQTGTRIVWGKSATIFQFLMPTDFMTVIVFAPETQATNDILDMYRVHGQIVHHSEKTTKNKKQVNIMFNNPTSAMHALGHKEKRFSTKPRLVNFTHANQTPSSVILNVTWTRRKNIGNAVVIFDKNPQVDFSKIRSSKGFEDASIDVDLPMKRIIIRNLNKTLSKVGVESGVQKVLGDDKVKIEKIQITQEPGFQTSEEEIVKLNNKLKNIFATVLGNKVVVTVKDPNLRDDTWSATVSVNNFQLTRTSLDSIRELTMDECQIHFTTKYFCCIFCGPELLDAVKKDFVADLENRKAQRQESSYNLRVSTSIVNNGKLVIKFDGDDLEEVAASYQCLAHRLRASFFDVSKYELTERFSFDETKDDLIEKCSLRVKTFVGFNKFSNQLTVVGDSEIASEVEEILQLEMAITQSLDNIEIYCGQPNGLIRELVKLYKSQFNGLYKVVGVTRVKFNIENKTLRLWGSEATTNKMNDVIRSVSSNLSRSSGNEETASEVCPVCSDDVHKADHNYRMESCGHAYCFPCMCAFVANSTPPLCCMFNNCSAPIVFRDLTNLQQECTLILRNLADRATAVYLQHNKAAFFFCPVPDCDGILKRQSTEEHCAKCFNTICFRCEVLYHYGQSCIDYQKMNTQTSQTSIQADDTLSVQKINYESKEINAKPNESTIESSRSCSDSIIKTVLTESSTLPASTPNSNLDNYHSPPESRVKFITSHPLTSEHSTTPLTSISYKSSSNSTSSLSQTKSSPTVTIAPRIPSSPVTNPYSQSSNTPGASGGCLSNPRTTTNTTSSQTTNYSDLYYPNSDSQRNKNKKKDDSCVMM